MKRIGKYAAGALMLAGSALGMTLAATAPADAHVSVGIGIGVPGYYGYDRDPCASPRFRYYHREYCYAGYGPAAYYGPGYAGGFWFTDSFGHRQWHGGGYHGGGYGGGYGGGHWSGHGGGGHGGGGHHH
jgi:hypothetical protein